MIHQMVKAAVMLTRIKLHRKVRRPVAMTQKESKSKLQLWIGDPVSHRARCAPAAHADVYNWSYADYYHSGSGTLTISGTTITGLNGTFDGDSVTLQPPGSCCTILATTTSCTHLRPICSTQMILRSRTQILSCLEQRVAARGGGPKTKPARADQNSGSAPSGLCEPSVARSHC